jgi:DNA-binding LacI/PurR family transcriptional regulator
LLKQSTWSFGQTSFSTEIFLDCHVSLHNFMGEFILMTSKQRLTSHDVARESGLSRATVSYVLNNDPRQTIPEETRQRVLKAARKLGYRPSAPARALRAGYSQLILGVVQFEQVDPNMARDMHYLEAELAKRQFTLIWHVGSQLATGQGHPSANLAPAVVIAFVDETAPALRNFLRQFDVPVLSLVNASARQATGEAQVAYLSEHGKRSMVFAAPERSDLQSLAHARLEGVRKECAKRGLKPPLVQVVPSPREGAIQAIKTILDKRTPPLGICCYNDEIAFGVLSALTDQGVSIPNSVGVIGCDNIPLSQLSIPPLTTIAFDNREFLDSLIENIVAAAKRERMRKRPLIPLSVIERDSA